MAERPFNYADYAFGGNVVVAQVMKDEMGRVAKNPLLSFVPREFGRIGGALYSMDTAIARFIQGDPQKNRHFSTGLCKVGIRSIGSAQRDPYSEVIETADPPANFREWKGEKSWGDWLMSSSRHGGPTRSQFRDILAWNLQTMIDVNTRRADELEGQKTTFLENSQQAVEEGRLSSQFLQRAAEVLPDTRFLITDPLNLQYDGGSAHRRGRVSLLAPTYDKHTAVHEAAHLIGAFEGTLLNEVATEMIGEEIYPGVIPEDLISHYVFMERVVKATFERAGITTHDISELYVGTHKKANTERLRDLVKERTGQDELRTLEDKFRQRRKFWLPRSLFNRDMAVMLAGLDLLKDIEPDLSYAELLRRDLPSHFDELQELPGLLEAMRERSLKSIVMDIFSAQSKRDSDK